MSECKKCREVNCGCSSGATAVQPPLSTNTPECPSPEPCPEVISTQCIQYIGEDKNCGEDTVYESGDTIAEVDSKIVDYFCEQIVNINNTISEIPIDNTQYTEVAISSAQILTMGSSPKNILPNGLGENPYYDIEKCIIEYHNVTPYSLDVDILIMNGFDKIVIDRQFITIGASCVVTLKSLSGVDNSKITPSLGRNFAITTTDYSTNPTGGTGTMLFKIWYKVRTFGSEL
jgi:hypothetical protein